MTTDTQYTPTKLSLQEICDQLSEFFGEQAGETESIARREESALDFFSNHPEGNYILLRNQAEIAATWTVNSVFVELSNLCETFDCDDTEARYEADCSGDDAGQSQSITQMFQERINHFLHKLQQETISALFNEPSTLTTDGRYHSLGNRKRSLSVDGKLQAYTHEQRQTYGRIILEYYWIARDAFESAMAELD